MFSMIMISFKIMILFIPILLSVAVFTLFESKIMGYMQKSQGPIKVGFLGILQPFSDGLKLILKEPMLPLNSNYLMYMSAPMLTLMLSLMSWILIPFEYGLVICDLNVGILFILGMSSLSVYGIIMAGWASNSKYAFLGALSSAAQMMSYELSMSLILITMLVTVGSLNLTEMVMAQKDIWFFIPFFPMFMLFLISAMAETNRHPFDLPEAEAELVSGYNVEYSSMGFAFFFMGEYANILLMSSIIVIFFFGGWLSPFNLLIFNWMHPMIWFSLKVMFMVWMFIMLRALLPRYRYDQLMILGWKVFLPLSLGFFLFYYGILYGFDWLP